MSASSAPAPKRRRLNFSENITVLVGSEPDIKSFIVHKSILTKSSEFFKACCLDETRWREGIDKTVKLPETQPDTFEMYMQWLYTGDLVVSDEYDLEDAKDWNKDLKEEVSVQYGHQLRELAIHAGMVNDNNFCNAVADLLLKTSEDAGVLPHHTLISSICSELPESAPIRQLVEDIFVRHASDNCFEAMKDMRYPWGFRYDVRMVLTELADNGNAEARWPIVTWANRCNYHIHGEGEGNCV